jgi:MFS family permease
MRRYSFSIRGLMAFIVILGVAILALRTPSRIWANACYSIALGAVTVSISAAVASVAERRAFWVGFATCGGVYFLFALAPWFDEKTSHQLVTTTMLDLAAPYLVDNAYLLNAHFLTMNPPSPPDAPTSWQQWNLPDFRTSGNEKWAVGYVTLHSPFLYLRIGHALFCLLAAIAGGEVSRYLFVASQRSATTRAAA